MTGGTRPGTTGPGILETSLVIGGSLLLAGAMVVFFGGQLGQLLDVLVNLAHGG